MKKAAARGAQVRPPERPSSTVTLRATPNGRGDNGYNDAASEGVFAFAAETGTRLRLLLPKDETET